MVRRLEEEADFIQLGFQVKLLLPEQFKGWESPSPQPYLFPVLSSPLLQLFLNYNDSFGFTQSFSSSEPRSRSKMMSFLVRTFQLAAFKRLSPCTSPGFQPCREPRTPSWRVKIQPDFCTITYIYLKSRSALELLPAFLPSAFPHLYRTTNSCT